MWISQHFAWDVENAQLMLAGIIIVIIIVYSQFLNVFTLYSVRIEDWESLRLDFFDTLFSIVTKIKGLT